MQLIYRCHLGNAGANWFCECSGQCVLPFSMRFCSISTSSAVRSPFLRTTTCGASSSLSDPLSSPSSSLWRYNHNCSNCWKHISHNLMQRMKYLCFNSRSFLVANLLFDLTQEFRIGRLYIRYIIAFRHYSFSSQWIKRFEDDAQTTLGSLRKSGLQEHLVALIWQWSCINDRFWFDTTQCSLYEWHKSKCQLRRWRLATEHKHMLAVSCCCFRWFMEKIARIGKCINPSISTTIFLLKCYADFRGSKADTQLKFSWPNLEYARKMVGYVWRLLKTFSHKSVGAAARSLARSLTQFGVTMCALCVHRTHANRIHIRHRTNAMSHVYIYIFVLLRCERIGVQLMKCFIIFAVGSELSSSTTFLFRSAPSTKVLIAHFLDPSNEDCSISTSNTTNAWKCPTIKCGPDKFRAAILSFYGFGRSEENCEIVFDVQMNSSKMKKRKNG